MLECFFCLSPSGIQMTRMLDLWNIFSRFLSALSSPLYFLPVKIDNFYFIFKFTKSFSALSILLLNPSTEICSSVIVFSVLNFPWFFFVHSVFAERFLFFIHFKDAHSCISIASLQHVYHGYSKIFFG